MITENQKTENIDIASEMQKPQSTLVDGTRVENRPLPDLIKADEHLANKTNPAAAIKTFCVAGNSMR